MFTGLIEHLGTVVSVEAAAAGRRILIDPDAGTPWRDEAELGESIAIDGCCLTVAEVPAPGEALAFDAIPETLARTTLGDWEAGRRVHLERSMTASTLMGGHTVQGHVDAVGEVARVSRDGGAWRTTIRVPEEYLVLLPAKGSVAVDGVSLTIASVDIPGRSFDLALIPTTLEKTHLDGAVAGARVNLESDVIVRTVVNTLTHFRQVIGEGG